MENYNSRSDQSGLRYVGSVYLTHNVKWKLEENDLLNYNHENWKISKCTAEYENL